MIDIKLLQGDCLKIVDNILSESIDCIICDPPYNINYNNLDWDKNFNILEMIMKCARVLKPNGNLLLFQGWSNVCETKQFIDNYCDYNGNKIFTM